MTRIPISKHQWRFFRRTVGQNIKTLRQARKMSIEELAEKIGHTPERVHALEETCRTIQLYDLLHIAIALDIPPSAFVAGAYSFKV